jgi:protein CpxP
MHGVLLQPFTRATYRDYGRPVKSKVEGGNTMKRNLMMKFATIAAMTAGIALAQQAPANPPAAANTPMHRPFARMHQRVMKALNLTDAQKQQARAIFQETRQKTEPIRAELRQNRQALTAAIKADNKADIQKLSKADGELMGRVMVARNEARAKFYSILTPEQREAAQKLHAAFRHRMEQRREQRRG